jgi:hypothetical protein
MTRQTRKILTIMLSTVMMLLLVGMSTVAEGSIGFREDFSEPVLDPAWTVSDTYPGHGYYSLTGNSLRYYVQPWSTPGGDTPTPPNEWGYVYYPSMILSRSFSGTDWTFETKFTYYMPYSNGRALLTEIWIGDDGVRPSGGSSGKALSIDFTKWADQAGGGPSAGELYISASTPSGSLANMVLPCSTTEETYYVKIIRDGYQFTLQYSNDEVNYTQAFTFTAPASRDGKVQKVVLSGHSWATPAGSYADYDYISVTPEPATVCLLGLGALGLLRKRRA